MTCLRTDHQWTAPKESVKTGGPNWQKQTLQASTIPPGPSMQHGKSADWSGGMQAGHFPMQPSPQPMMMGGGMQPQPMMGGQPPMMGRPMMGAGQPMMMGGGMGQPMMMQQQPMMQPRPFMVSSALFGMCALLLDLSYALFRLYNLGCALFGMYVRVCDVLT